MEHLDNDMDDLFQRAAKSYPLNTGRGDWESVAKKIAIKDDSKGPVVPLKSKKNKRLFLLLLFLSIGLAGWFTLHIPISGPFQQNLSVKTDKRNKNTSNETKSKNNKIELTQKPGVTDLNEGHGNKKNIRQFHANSSVTILAPNNPFNSKKKTEGSVETKSKTNTTIAKPGDTNTDFSLPVNSQEKSDDGTTQNPGNSESLAKNDAGMPGETAKDNKESKEQKNENNKQSNIKKNNKPKSSYQKKQGLYIGVVTGLDYSKVGSGSFDNMGFDAGFLLGYRINGALSFETAFMWNKKIYYSDGKHFNLDKVGSTMPSGMIINSLNSHSSVIEIPIKARYDFIRKTSSDLFFAGGVSAYIMTKEKNMYHVTYNGTQEKVLGIYEKNSYRLPAVANVSIGYERNISRLLEIRIEPFLKIPLQGIGVGSLPVTSAGLQIGITGHLK
jgi:hypothetical protein